MVPILYQSFIFSCCVKERNSKLRHLSEYQYVFNLARTYYDTYYTTQLLQLNYHIIMPLLLLPITVRNTKSPRQMTASLETIGADLLNDPLFTDGELN